MSAYAFQLMAYRRNGNIGDHFMYVCAYTQTFLGLVEVFAAIVLFELLVGCVEGGLINWPDDKLCIGSWSSANSCIFSKVALSVVFVIVPVKWGHCVYFRFQAQWYILIFWLFSSKSLISDLMRQPTPCTCGQTGVMEHTALQCDSWGRWLMRKVWRKKYRQQW